MWYTSGYNYAIGSGWFYVITNYNTCSRAVYNAYSHIRGVLVANTSLVIKQLQINEYLAWWIDQGMPKILPLFPH